MKTKKYDPQERRYRRVLEELKTLREDIKSLRNNQVPEFRMDGKKHRINRVDGGVSTCYPQRCRIVGDLLILMKCHTDEVDAMFNVNQIRSVVTSTWT